MSIKYGNKRFYAGVIVNPVSFFSVGQKLPALPCTLGWSFLFTVLWNTMNHGSHKNIWLFRSKALQKAKKIKNLCRFRVWNLPSKFLKKSLSKMIVFISKMKWHFLIYFFFQIFHFQTNFFFLQKITFTLEMSFWDLLYWCRSKIKKVRGGLKSYNWSLWGPL